MTMNLELFGFKKTTLALAASCTLLSTAGDVWAHAPALTEMIRAGVTLKPVDRQASAQTAPDSQPSLQELLRMHRHAVNGSDPDSDSDDDGFDPDASLPVKSRTAAPVPPVAKTAAAPPAPAKAPTYAAAHTALVVRRAPPILADIRGGVKLRAVATLEPEASPEHKPQPALGMFADMQKKLQQNAAWAASANASSNDADWDSDWEDASPPPPPPSAPTAVPPRSALATPPATQAPSAMPSPPVAATPPALQTPPPLQIPSVPLVPAAGANARAIVQLALAPAMQPDVTEKQSSPPRPMATAVPGSSPAAPATPATPASVKAAPAVKPLSRDRLSPFEPQMRALPAAKPALAALHQSASPLTFAPPASAAADPVAAPAAAVAGPVAAAGPAVKPLSKNLLSIYEARMRDVQPSVQPAVAQKVQGASLATPGPVVSAATGPSLKPTETMVTRTPEEKRRVERVLNDLLKNRPSVPPPVQQEEAYAVPATSAQESILEQVSKRQTMVLILHRQPPPDASGSPAPTDVAAASPLLKPPPILVPLQPAAAAEELPALALPPAAAPQALASVPAPQELPPPAVAAPKDQPPMVLAPAAKRKRPADLTIDTDTRYEFDGKMGRAARLIKKGRGTLVLNHAGEMRRGVHLKQGRIELGHAQGLGAGSLLMDDGSAIDLAAEGMTVGNDIHMTGSDDPEINTGDHHQTWAGAISGAGFLTKQGAGSLTLTNAANRYSGLTEVAQGTLQAGAVNTFSAASVHNVATDARLNLAGFDQTIAGLNNRGTVQFGSAPATPGTVLTVTGPYVGHGGELAIAAHANASDRLLLSGASAVGSGSTTVRITNVGDLGVATTGNGIEVISTENGARLDSGAFSLAGGHVDAGAYAYRLQQTAEGASLQSSYRAEVPLLAALPAQLRQADIDMLGSMHQRLGDTPGGAGMDRRAWGRMLRTEPSVRQQGTVSPQSSGHLTGFQTGLDLYAGRKANAGFYLGQLKGDMRVSGRTRGAGAEHVGANRLHGRYLGLYASWQGNTGMYADTVLQWADHRSHSHTQDSHAATKGRSRLASLEVGQPLGIDSRWQIEPQAQLVYRQLRLDDTALSHAAVQHKTPGDWTLRVGARIRGSFATSAGALVPYASVNVYKASSATDVARFVAPVATTDIQTRGGHTSTALAAGASLQVNQRTSFYGELSQQWAHGGNARVGSGVQASAGVKLHW